MAGLSIILGCITLSAFRVAAAQTSGVTSLLGQISTAFSNGVPIGSIQLTGRVDRYAGPDTDSGTISLTARADGSTQIQMNLSGGVRTESQTAVGPTRTCEWSGPDGVIQDSSGPNCWPALVWFLPQISLQPGKTSPLLSSISGGIQATTVGTLSVLQNQVIASSFSRNAAAVSQIQAQSMTLLFIDPATNLPRLLSYTIHSDTGSAVISVEIQFSNYQRMGGLMIPTHIERHLNGSLEYSVDVAQASVLN